MYVLKEMARNNIYIYSQSEKSCLCGASVQWQAIA